MSTQTAEAASTQVRKYLFDLTFDNEAGCCAPERQKTKQTFSQEQLEAAQKGAYEKGFSEGQKTMAEDQQQYMNTLLSKIDQNTSHLITESLGEWQRQLAQLQEIALVIARKIMPTFVARHGLEEVESIVAKIVTEMSHEPRLVFRVNEAQFDDAKTRINAIAESAAYAGKLVILGDPDLGPSECRVEWADGGIERDIRALWQDIDRVMDEVQTLEPASLETTTETAPPPIQAERPPVETAPTAIQEKSEQEALPPQPQQPDLGEQK
ncbi:MAG: FliH/SctL family protein [Bdellovibrionales bacterium]|jgi:flagellar assembly protein FliH